MIFISPWTHTLDTTDTLTKHLVISVREARYLLLIYLTGFPGWQDACLEQEPSNAALNGKFLLLH